MNTKEIWLPIPELELYWASSLGRIRSFKTGVWQILKLRKHESTRNTGYWKVNLKRHRKSTTFLVHRLVGLAFGIIDTTDQLDHINRDGLDNQVSNLRKISQSQNNYNRSVFKKNKHGVTGVFKNGNRWYAGIRINKVQHSLGSFLTFEEACQARKSFEQGLALREGGEYDT